MKRPQKIRGNVENELERLITPWKTRLAESYTTQLYKCERRHVQVSLDNRESISHNY